FRINAFWASENFEAFIVVAPPSRGIYAAPTLAKNGPVCRPQIMGHKEDCHVWAEPFEQVKNLLLRGYIESRGRLVSDEKLRLHRERHCNHDALIHSAWHFVRIVSHRLFGIIDPHIAE
ncbi:MULTISPECIES: hypothetical protein, partial [unclassified Bradyrhizobium]|uniref:hypothetical protein n=1 Tax=unclassified Bradyrhizobium TaxID=2631580 RepID=UPI0023E038F8